MTRATLPSECTLRRARPGDRWAILKLVLSQMLDPTQLRVRQFWVIECKGEVVACGQLRQFDGAQELGSMVVAAPWRDRGLGTALAQQLIHSARDPLYLECMSRLVPFYQRLGFESVAWQQVPESLKWKFGASQLGSKVLPISVTLMRYGGVENR